MRVDDVGERAGAELRDRFADEYAPALPWELVASPARRTYMSRFVLVLAGLMVVAVAATLAGFALDARNPTGSGGHAPMWQRASITFNGVDSLSLDSYERGFIAVGGDRQGALVSKVTPRIWRSRDGVAWSKAPTKGLPRFISGNPGGVVSNGSRHVLIWNGGDRLRLYWSRDLRSWTPAASLAAGGTFDVAPYRSGFLLSVRGGELRGRGPYRGYESPDGRSWQAIDSWPNPLVVTGLPPGFLMNGRYITRTYDPPFPGVAPGVVGIYGSRDRRHWTLIADAVSNLLLGELAVDRGHQRLFGIQFEPSRTEPGGRLMATRDGRTWSEITSFHERFPTGNPNHLERSGSWWVLSGNRGGQTRRATMWATPDLVHWIELPMALRGPISGGGNMRLAESGGRVVGIGSDAGAPRRLTWIWHRPDAARNLVSVNGRPDSHYPPCCKQAPEVLGTAIFERTDASRVSVDVVEPGRFTVDLEPGTYRMTGICGAQTVEVRAGDDRVEVTCRVV